MGLTFDEQLRALGSTQRRRILADLLLAGPESGIAARPPATDEGTTGEESRIRLHHVDLPLLVVLDLVARGDDGSVTRGDSFDEIEPMLALFVEHTDNWPGAFSVSVSAD
ncbi:hypothetical protein [Halobaculum lipolyticum]|uniref:ArsR family transcriptional regulator n=1 Tax=Halobaculum lipolyticum TaxID=3032001 RepID=A0ABD5WF74_9EURY|nr:hypothetical protein [Halobaculum sp. DT31]